MQVAPLPEVRVVDLNVNGSCVRKRVADARFDVVLKRKVSALAYDGSDERTKLYGSTALYAASKRQLSRREKKMHRLP